MVPPDVRGGTAHLARVQLYMGFILNPTLCDVNVGLNKWKSSVYQEDSCYDSGGIQAMELRRRWCFGF